MVEMYFYSGGKPQAAFQMWRPRDYHCGGLDVTLPWPPEDPDTYLLDCPSASLFSDENEGPSPVSWGVFDRQRFETLPVFSGGVIKQK